MIKRIYKWKIYRNESVYILVYNFCVKMCFLIGFDMDVIRTFLVLTILIPCCWYGKVDGRMNGADPMACRSLIPTGHGTSQQNTNSPFIIDVSSTQYTPGGNLQVTIRTNQPNFNFRGFLLQARHAEDVPPYDTEPVEILGTWNTPSTNMLSRLLDCAGNLSNSVTHAEREYQSSVSFTWNVPNMYMGNIKFVATVVRDFWTWWTTESSELRMRDPCESNPCPADSTCTRTTDGTFLCLCQDGSTTTTTCQVTDPCMSNPCPSGSTCTRQIGGTHTCLCADGSASPTMCPSAVSPTVCSSTPCRNGGMCFVTQDGHYSCECAIGFTGTTCEEQDPCSVNPCLNSGICYAAYTNDGPPFLCVCQRGFIGLLCQDPDPCFSNPCLNQGGCSTNAQGGYVCTCATDFTGPRCEQALINTPCTPSPCQNQGACTSLGTTSYSCRCTSGFTGTNCEIATTTTNTACDANPCVNFGTCLPSGTDSYTCQCVNGFTGAKCEIGVGSCSPNPCFYGGTCVTQQNNGYSCTCQPGYSGTNCGTITTNGPCTPSPCLNDGVCTVTGTNSYTCRCRDGFTGTTCQQALNTACDRNPCLNQGSCTPLGTSFYTCQCTDGFTGINCEQATTTACDRNPCFNQGVCTSSGTSSYTCQCTSRFTGTNCEQVRNTACAGNPCLNQGVCTTSGTSSYTCQCTNGFIGTNCEQVRNTACDQNPCLNQGVCTTSGTSSYTCRCTNGFIGTNCEQARNTRCDQNPCLNQGTCTTSGTSSYTCRCTNGYLGINCEQVRNTRCDQNPCLNQGVCIISGSSSYTCQCTSGFIGSNCEQVRNAACDRNPCLNQGVCTTSGTSSYTCQCTSGFTGTNCEQVRNAACDRNPCLNQGVCTTSGTSSYTCRCTSGFTGTNCDQARNTACDTNPCSNQGECTTTGTNSFLCRCNSGFTGTNCQIARNSACDVNPCENGGACQITGTSSFTCLCTNGFFGSNCQERNTACDINPCANLGTCIISGTSTFTCQCQTGFSGSACEEVINIACNTDPCLSQGTCFPVGTSLYRCQCREGFTGNRCEQALNVACNNVPCYHGGSCIAGIGSAIPYTCVCVPGYTGNNCEVVPSNPCVSNPCPSSASCSANPTQGRSYTCTCPDGTVSFTTCTDPCNPKPHGPCGNNGVCFRAAQTYTNPFLCACNAGYMGVVCEIATTVNACASSPCLFDGICVQQSGGTYRCICPTGRTGVNCERVPPGPNLGPCDPNPCVYGACSINGADYICTCNSGWKGRNCDSVDLPPPTFEGCPGNQIQLTYPLEQGETNAFVDLRIQARDNSGNILDLQVVNGPAVIFPAKIAYHTDYRFGQAFTYRATDPATGLYSDCDFVIRLQDTEPPTLKCPENIVRATFETSVSIEWPAATATDNLQLRPDNTMLYSMPSGSIFQAFPQPRPQTIVVRAYDTFNNEGVCSFEVSAQMLTDAPPPTFTNCPQGETKSYTLTPKTNKAFVDLNIQARDATSQPAVITTLEGPVLNLPGDVVYDESYRRGQIVRLQASDANGVTSDCSFTLKLVDDDPPQVDCPSNIVDQTTNNGKVINWREAEVTDNLKLRSINPIEYDPPNATMIKAASDGFSQIVTVTTWDSFNNEGSCQFLITLYQIDLTCSPFPQIINGEITCGVTLGGNMLCRVVCTSGYVFAPASASYTCKANNGVATWDPLPVPDAICINPKAGTEIRREVQLVFHMSSATDSLCNNEAQISTVPGQMRSAFSINDLCTRGTASACKDITATCIDLTPSSRRRKKRAALSDIRVDVVVSSPTFGSQMHSLTDLQNNVISLANDILAYANSGDLTIQMGEAVSSDANENEISDNFVWKCMEGERSTLNGCVSCPPGTFLDDTNRCQFCDIGLYQNVAEKRQCEKCPEGSTTYAKGSYDNDHCKHPNKSGQTGWNAQFTVIIIITVLLFVILVMATITICCWKYLNKDRSDPYADSLSNLKYLNQAYEDESTLDARSRGASNHFIRRQNRQYASNGTTITTGYLMASDGEHSRANSRSELVSITDSMAADDYLQQQRTGTIERHAHFSPTTETINRSSTTLNGSVGTGVSHTNSNGTLPNGISTISQPPPPTPPPTPPPVQNGGPRPRSTRREFIPMTLT